MPRAVVYCRISRDPTGTALGVARQETECRARAEQMGWDVADVLTDNDMSAYSGKSRPGYERLLAGLAAGEWKAVIAWHPDRLTRSPRELERLIDVIDAAKAKVATVQAGEYDLSTPSGRMTARVVGAVARHESEHKSARLRAKHRQLAEAGALPGGGTRPFGYRADRVTVHTAEADIVRDLVARLLAGESVRGLAADLNARGISTPAGKAWSPFSLRRMLLSPRIAGLRQHQGATVGAAVWPGIISPDDHVRVVSLLTDPARRTNGSPRGYLLTGIASCGLCGGKLVARPRSDKTRCYVCSSGPGFGGCGKIRVLAEPLEDLVAGALLHRFDGVVLERQSATPDRTGEVESLEARLVELAETWAAGNLDGVSWHAARNAVEKQLAEVRAGIANQIRTEASATLLVDTDGLRERWPVLAFDRRRAIITAVIGTVTVGPAVRGRNRFDGDRVSVRWR